MSPEAPASGTRIATALLVEAVLLLLGCWAFVDGVFTPDGFDPSSGLDTGQSPFVLATTLFILGGLLAVAISRRLWAAMPAVPFVVSMAVLTIW